jgi:hypothetical protein
MHRSLTPINTPRAWPLLVEVLAGVGIGVLLAIRVVAISVPG